MKIFLLIPIFKLLITLWFMQNLNFNATVKEKTELLECPICVICIFFLLDRKSPLRLEDEELQKTL